MRRHFLAGIPLFGLVLGGCGGAPPTPTVAAVASASPDPTTAAWAGPRIRVVVGGFDEPEAIGKLLDTLGWRGIAPLITEQAVTSLVNGGRVTVLERGQIGKVVANTKLEQDGELQEFFAQETSVEKGRLLGAQAMLVGSITQFEPNVEGGGMAVGFGDIVGLRYHEDKAVVGVDLRLVDAQTGRVLAAGQGEGEVKTTSSGGHVGYQGLTIGSDG